MTELELRLRALHQHPGQSCRHPDQHPSRQRFQPGHDMSDKRALHIAILKAGGVRAVARTLAISTESIVRWPMCPALHVVELERLSGVPREALRPDLIPDRAVTVERAT